MNKLLNLESLATAQIARLEQKLLPRPPRSEGFYQGYDAVRGLHRVLVGHRILYGIFRSTGSVGVGEAVAVYWAPPSQIASFDCLPR
jgi:hypothetical protein